jgi:hypothetical protein
MPVVTNAADGTDAADAADAADGFDVATAQREAQWEAHASRALDALTSIFGLEPGTLSVEHHAHRPHQPHRLAQAESPSLPSPPPPPPPTPERANPATARGGRATAPGTSESKHTHVGPNGGRMWLPASYARRPVSNAHGSKRASKQPLGVTPTMLAAAAASAAAGER